MKQIVKRCLGRLAISSAARTPRIRSLLKPIGLRCAQGLFGERIVEILHDGRPLRLTHLDECYLAFQIFWHGIDFYEPITRALLKELITPASTFMDLGAHLGFFSLDTGLSIPGTHIVAFEPNPKNFRILKANAAANDLPHMVCEPFAISDRNGTATLYLTESDMSASLMKNFQIEDTVQIAEIEVQTTTLDHYAQAHEVRGPLVLKVDIEGCESAFFNGAAQTIASFKPDIILEVLYEQDPRIVGHLKSLGYRFYPVTDQGLVELEAPKLIKRFPFLFLNHLLSARPKPELEAIFNRVRAQTQTINLLNTSKHFPPSEWPALWPSEANS